MPCASTRTAQSCGSFQPAPGRTAPIAAACAASTSSYTSFCAALKPAPTGKVRVMSAA